MPEISQYELDSLNRRVKIAQDVAKRKATEAKDALRRAADAEAEAVRSKGDLQRTVDENPLKAENEMLRGQIREGKHRAAFALAARERGADEAVIDAVWKLSGYEAKGETPSPDAIGAMLDEARTNPAIGRLFGPPKGDEGPPPPKPGFGGGQGTKAGGPAPYTMADNDPRASDAIYQFNNFDRIAQAASERIARGEI